MPAASQWSYLITGRVNGILFFFLIYFLMHAAASRFQPLTNKGRIVHAAEQTKWNRSFHIDGDHSVWGFLKPAQVMVSRIASPLKQKERSTPAAQLIQY